MKRRRLIAVLTVVAVAAVMIGYAFAQPGARPGRRESRPGNPRPRPMRAEDADRMGKFIGLVGAMKHVCFDPETAGVIAVGALKDDVRRKTADIAKDLEAQLAKTKTLGLRNALRLSLKDIYKKQEDDEKVLGHLRAMLAENDAALQAKKK